MIETWLKKKIKRGEGEISNVNMRRNPMLIGGEISNVNRRRNPMFQLIVTLLDPAQHCQHATVYIITGFSRPK